MKNLIVIIAIVGTLIPCRAQIVSLEQVVNFTNAQSGTYYKDIANNLQPYVGTWEGTWEDKIFTLVLSKVTINQTFPDGAYYLEDLLIGKYKVVDTNTNNILFNTLLISGNENAKIHSAGAGIGNDLRFDYSDPELCGVSGTIILSKNNDNLNHMRYTFFHNGMIIFEEDCPYFNVPIPIPIPTVSFDLIRVQ